MLQQQDIAFGNVAANGGSRYGSPGFLRLSDRLMNIYLRNSGEVTVELAAELAQKGADLQPGGSIKHINDSAPQAQ
ncbi:hypothetical protein [Pseudomonas sp. LD120]|uniref:hypothetical protein n=1 Tax=Pseudomonas sp. LD120 TaxID=485751 RepID=UPI00135AF568|nr:hypothetical protein [Pseudomonas sp. LD120]KAF0866469.1 hypothetical protein PLD_04040 [Pseudomonas sp. LD120]